MQAGIFGAISCMVNICIPMVDLTIYRLVLLTSLENFYSTKQTACFKFLGSSLPTKGLKDLPSTEHSTGAASISRSNKLDEPFVTLRECVSEIFWLIPAR